MLHRFYLEFNSIKINILIKKFIAHDEKCSTGICLLKDDFQYKLQLDRHGLLRKLHCDEYFMAILDLTFRYGL